MKGFVQGPSHRKFFSAHLLMAGALPAKCRQRRPNADSISRQSFVLRQRGRNRFRLPMMPPKRRLRRFTGSPFAVGRESLLEIADPPTNQLLKYVIPAYSGG